MHSALTVLSNEKERKWGLRRSLETEQLRVGHHHVARRQSRGLPWTLDLRLLPVYSVAKGREVFEMLETLSKGR